MKSIVINQFGGPEVPEIEERDAPVFEDTQILIRVKAIGVNPVETYFRSGSHDYKPRLPFVPGTDCAGIVEDVGVKVKKVKKGDRVYTSGTVSGAYAEYTVCTERQAHILPEDIDFSDGASINIPYGTAYRALLHKAGSEAGESVLIHGGTGGVGIAAIQLALHLDLKVFATYGSSQGRKLLKKLGIEYFFNHHDKEHFNQIRELSGGIDVIVEMLANVNLNDDLKIMAQNGRIIVVGNRGKIKINPRLAMKKESSIIGMSLASATESEEEEMFAAINKGLQEGYLKPVQQSVYPLKKAAMAHEELMEKPSVGKIILLP